MRIRTAVAATAIAALTVLGGAGAAAAAGPGPAGGHDRGNSIVNSEFVSTWIKDSFNTVVIFGDNI
ncbi:hypothetical protein ACIBLA_36850 [Streptomyces sp. NPDC050433]|uniref:hypothetical protein n=1 Tax=unclassified Streptomyces TaxID=2593676 RepID=UPI003416A7D4